MYRESYVIPVHDGHTKFHLLWGMLQRTMLQRNKFYKEELFINKIGMLQRTQMLQRTRRNTIGRRSTRVRMTCRAFPL
jgi:hypothetical protein